MENTPLILNERELSKKEIRMLKEMTTTRGLIKSWKWLQNPKYSRFIYEVFTSFSVSNRWVSNIAKIETGVNIKGFICELFDIPLHWSQRTRGQDQKLTYRCNRFSETITNIGYSLNSSSEELGHDLLWMVDMHRMVEEAIPHGNRGYYLNNFILTAKNKQEADSLALTMIGGPLGTDRTHTGIRILGHPDFFDYSAHNSRLLSEMLDCFDKGIKEAEELLSKRKENKEKVSYISAIVSQAGLMINGAV